MTNFTAEFRYVVAFLAALVGIAASVVDCWVDPPRPPPGPPPPPGMRREQTNEESLRIFELCIVFYGTTYFAGRLIYRLFGAHAEAETLDRWSQWHMMLLNLVGGGWLLASGVPAIQQGIFRPSVVVGAALLAVAIYDFSRALRKPQRQTFEVQLRE